MSKDPSQGQVADPKHHQGHPLPQPDGAEIIRRVGADVDRKYAHDHKSRPAQRVGGKQDPYKG